MSRNRRIALVGLTVAVAVAALVVVSCGGDDDDEASSNPPAARTETGPGEAESAPEGEKPSSGEAKPTVTRIKIQNGKPVGGVKRITVKKDEVVGLDVSSSDTTSEVHVHGFDIIKDLKPGRPASFLFTADIEGAFDVELEETETRIATLTVEP